jgi:hypothetical protein
VQAKVCFFLAFRGDLRSHGNALKKQLFDKPTTAKSGISSKTEKRMFRITTKKQPEDCLVFTCGLNHGSAFAPNLMNSRDESPVGLTSGVT